MIKKRDSFIAMVVEFAGVVIMCTVIQQYLLNPLLS